LRKSFKYRLYPNKTQRHGINNQLFHAHILYNTAITERREAYRSIKKSINYYDQASQLKELRAEGLVQVANFSACQDILRRVDKTYKAFYERIKRGDKPGFPRFKPVNRYNTLTYPSYNDGCKLKNNKVYLQGIGDINIRLHRPVEGKIKTVSISRINNKYYVIFSCEVTKKLLPPTENSIGIDVGLESFAVTSDGNFKANPRFYKKSQKKLRVLQRSVSRKKKGSVCRKKSVKALAKQHEKIANQRSDFLHKYSFELIKNNDIICIEDLNIIDMSKGMLAKSVHDVGWNIFFKYLSYKAGNAGREIRKINPNGTSQRCSRCGTEVKKDLSVRWHDCPVCGLSVHRDLNSAYEILRLGTSPNPLTCAVGQCVGLEAD